MEAKNIIKNWVFYSIFNDKIFSQVWVDFTMQGRIQDFKLGGEGAPK